MEHKKDSLLEVLKKLLSIQERNLRRLREQPSTAKQYEAIDTAEEKVLLTKAEILRLEIEREGHHG